MTWTPSELLGVVMMVAGAFSSFGWLVWWLSGQFTAVKSLIHHKTNSLDRRVSRLEWHNGVKPFDDDDRSSAV